MNIIHDVPTFRFIAIPSPGGITFLREGVSKKKFTGEVYFQLDITLTNSSSAIGLITPIEHHQFAM